MVKSQIQMNFGVSFQKDNSLDSDFDQISHTWLKFWIVVTILGYIFEWPVNFEVSFSQKFMNFRV